MFKIVNLIIEVVNWFRIVISPTLLGFVVGAGIYSFSQNSKGEFIWVSCTVFGGIFGVFWASRVWKNEGTTTFISKVNSSPDLNETDNQNKP